jgi:hypothetical protein
MSMKNLRHECSTTDKTTTRKKERWWTSQLKTSKSAKNDCEQKKGGLLNTSEHLKSKDKKNSTGGWQTKHYRCVGFVLTKTLNKRLWQSVVTRFARFVCLQCFARVEVMTSIRHPSVLLVEVPCMASILCTSWKMVPQMATFTDSRWHNSKSTW